MISVEEALKIVRQQAIELPAVEVPLAEANQKILREPLRADRDFPPFDRVTMDGIALSFADFAAGKRSFPIAGVGAAGAPQQELTRQGHCIEIMTGAMLPAGTDTVVRYEDLEIRDQEAHLTIDKIKKGQNIHRRGEDRQRGDVIVPAGRKIAPGEIGVAATVGRASLPVTRPITALILSSGDELVAVEEKPLPHQIRQSNVFSIQALLQRWGIRAQIMHMPDDPATIKKVLQEQLPNYDVLLLSGGVSKGKFDYIPDALDAMGVKRLFHRVAQRPGKPFWFGHIPGGTVVFALPGNPVSSLACTRVYFGEWLETSLGISEEKPRAQLSREVSFRPDLNYFIQVKLRSAADGNLLADPVEGHGSGDLANLVDADAFLMLPRGKDHFAAGEAYPVWSFR
ncbi:molybdopterin molybdotransferase MoeA [Flavilitoribacter nigricans]|uniref:Molybdopterin molybdenumtransferase n=1 Tax=Flavilitoribacter nigricans (strain ATCC 23147 / DSM 23189 / NBRC 102662 / NCIMB 1420 / SS-2) TaxID=1122177 RepID=A0A2D0N4F8_FLAN2|nr:molybdopterin molybdotransferase MoeA [Flavilitoribacter nigricans]PHN03029.1 molybdopterin molybdenumtransferase MoeA [Flavilitoribacter nigricans DSM 23189 = NBRC 102662]